MLWIQREHAASHLIELEGFEQGLEIALAEAFVALALNDFEETGANHVLRENLQQQALSLQRRAVDQDAPRAQARQVFAMAGNARIDRLVIARRRVLEAHPLCAHAIDRRADIIGSERNMLDTLAAINVQKLLDLRLLVPALVKRNADLAVGTGHCLRIQARGLPLDVEESDLAEIEHALIELRPALHVAALDVVRQVIYMREPGALSALALRPALERNEVDIVDLAGAITVHEIEIGATDALDCRDVELHRANRAV